MMRKIVGSCTQGWVAGIDEAGRGPLAGPVVAAAVILDPGRRLCGLRDSKELTSRQRGRLARRIRERAASWSIAWADPREIDVLNILQATMLAMRRAVLGLGLRPERIVIDGNRSPDLGDLGIREVRTVVGGDRLIKSISAASILAKDSRDKMMMHLSDVYPGYGFCDHKGYPTPAHRQALNALGPCPLHRRSFSPVRQKLASDNPG